MMPYDNLAVQHRASAAVGGGRPALRHKRGGAWVDLSWSDYRLQADHAAAGLIDLGLQPGDRLGILAENRADWLVADIAGLSAGLVNVTMHAPLAPGQAAYQLDHSDARALIVSNQQQADKVLGRLGDLPKLGTLIAFDPVDGDGRITQVSWTELLGRGARLGPQEVLRREAGLTRDSLATLIYTSGTTGPPKGVMLSHGNLLSNAEGVAALEPIGPSDMTLSWLPYSHIYARTVDHYLLLLTGGTLALAESLETLIPDLAAVQPTLMSSVPRFYEKVWMSVAGLGPDDRRRRLRALFGPRLRWLTSGGAPLPRHVETGFADAGILLLEGYGLTESSPVICFNRTTAHKLGTVGRPLPGVEVRIAPDGEILTRGPHVMLGYWKDPAATAQTIVDGWLQTGDVGAIDADGYLAITDRKKDLIITSGGKNVAPAEIEGLLLADPYIDQVVLYGDRKPFVTALIVPNFPLLESKAHVLTSEGDFLDDPALLAFMTDRVARAMEAVSKPERVRAFLLLGRPFSLEADELTPTRKVRRRSLIAKYQDRLDALYNTPKNPADE